MNFLKYFFIFLSLWISVALYWAYYLSNISDLKIDTKVWTWEILKEQQLFAKYNINEELETIDSDEIWLKNQKNIEIFKKEIPELKIIKTSFSENINFNPENKIAISFWEEIDIYSLLWFKKVENWEYLCDWKILKSEKKAERCNSENKIFITKILENWEIEEEKVFKWIIKKSNIDKKSILISTKLDELQNYQLKILKWLTSFKINTSKNPENKEFSELKNEFIINFTTTDKDWNIKIEKIKESLEKSWTWEIVEKKLETNILEETNNWIKQKEAEIWIQENTTESWTTSTWKNIE